MIILFTCLVGCLHSSPVEIKKIRHHLSKTAWAYAWAGLNAGMGWHEYRHAHASALGLMRATVLGTLCILFLCYLSKLGRKYSKSFGLIQEILAQKEVIKIIERKKCDIHLKHIKT